MARAPLGQREWVRVARVLTAVKHMVGLEFSALRISPRP
jgi:hypothetical protein